MSRPYGLTDLARHVAAAQPAEVVLPGFLMFLRWVVLILATLGSIVLVAGYGLTEETIGTYGTLRYEANAISWSMGTACVIWTFAQSFTLFGIAKVLEGVSKSK